MTEIADTAPLKPPHVRLLKVAVVVMGLLIMAGLAAVALRIAYLAGAPPAPSETRRTLETQVRLALPAGASVRQIAVSGDRLAVHYDGPAGPGIAVVDIRTGTVASRIAIVPEPPR
jgi:hypothetical protein